MNVFLMVGLAVVLAEVSAQNSTELIDPPQPPEPIDMHFAIHNYLMSRMEQSGVIQLEPQVKHLALLRSNLPSYVMNYKENNEFRSMVLEYIKNLPVIGIFKWNLTELSEKLDLYLMHISLEDAVKYMEGLFDGFINVPHLKRIGMCRRMTKEECSQVYGHYSNTLVSKDRHPLLIKYPWLF